MEEKLVTIEDIIFHNRDNGYTIAFVFNEEEDFTAVGYLPSCNEGRTYVLRGDYINHPKYGKQFSFKESEEKVPNTEEGIKSFLSSGAISGIGDKAAKAIVEKFGTDTFKIIEESPEKLMEINGIGERKSESISQAFSKHREFAKISMALQPYDISAEYALKLYKVYGKETVAIVEENPYKLVDEIFGIGFKKADKIAFKVGVSLEDEYRIKSGINFTLGHEAGEGHTYLTKMSLCEKTAELLQVPIFAIEENLINMAFEGDVKLEKINEQEVVYSMNFYLAEQAVTRALISLNNAEIKPIDSHIDSLIEATENEKGVEFSQRQKEAVKSSVINGVSVITGGPGTGKTTIINAIIKILKESKVEVGVAAPTGRAAKRITETTGHEALTIHRLLEYSFNESSGDMRFSKNEENPLDFGAVIVDESSMIDLILMKALVTAIKPGTRFIMVGDADQLPSVGAGNILRNIIDSEYIYATRLNDIFRQAQESLIVINAHKINRGEYPDINEKNKDFFLLERDSEENMLNTVSDLCKTRLPKYYKEYNPVRDIQVLTPKRKGTLGTKELNNKLQEALNPPKAELKEKQFGEKIFREGDKVMQIKNNYSLKWKRQGDFIEGEGIFNGDIGFIEKIDTEFNEITVVFDENKYVAYAFDQLDELEIAYAITVHKSQGSEFPIVVMPISYFPPMLATRNLLYTAVTRGKEAVVLVGSRKKMEGMIDNNRITDRNSGLEFRLKEMLKLNG